MGDAKFKPGNHMYSRRRIKTEEKAMVVVAVWETELFQFLAALDTYFASG